MDQTSKFARVSFEDCSRTNSHESLFRPNLAEKPADPVKFDMKKEDGERL